MWKVLEPSTDLGGNSCCIRPGCVLGLCGLPARLPGKSGARVPFGSMGGDARNEIPVKLTVLGASPAVPTPGGASSGYLVQTPETLLLLDCGHAVASVLQTVTSIRRLSAIIISHMHPDHYFDLVPLKYAYLFQRIPPVPLLLPPGGLAILHRLQTAAGLRDSFFESSFEVSEYDPAQTLVQIAGLSIDFAPTQHFVPGYAMRFRSADSPRELAYSSDTGWVDSVLELFDGAAVGLVEATLLEDDPGEDIEGHLTAAQAGRLARQAGLTKLLLTHYWKDLGERLRAEAQSAFGGTIEMVEERTTYDV